MQKTQTKITHYEAFNLNYSVAGNLIVQQCYMSYPRFHFVRMNCVTCNLMADFNKSGSKINIFSAFDARILSIRWIQTILVIGHNQGGRK